MDEVEKYFHRKSTLGQRPSLEEMIEFCRKRKIPWTRKRLRELKSRWMFTAMFSRPTRHLKHMGAAVQRYGLVQVRLQHLSSASSSGIIASSPPPREAGGSGQLLRSAWQED